MLHGERVTPGSGPPGTPACSRANPDPFYYRPDLDAPRHPACSRPPGASSSGGVGVPVLSGPRRSRHPRAGRAGAERTRAGIAVGTRAVWDLPADCGFHVLCPERRRRSGRRLARRLCRRGAIGGLIEQCALALGRRYRRDPGSPSSTSPAARGAASSPQSGSGASSSTTASTSAARACVVLDLARREGGSGGLVQRRRRSGSRASSLAVARALGSRLLPSAADQRRGRWAPARAARPRSARARCGLGTHPSQRVMPRRTRAGGYWLISTCSLIDHPQELRALRVRETQAAARRSRPGCSTTCPTTALATSRGSSPTSILRAAARRALRAAARSQRQALQGRAESAGESSSAQCGAVGRERRSAANQRPPAPLLRMVKPDCSQPPRGPSTPRRAQGNLWLLVCSRRGALSAFARAPPGPRPRPGSGRRAEQRAHAGEQLLWLSRRSRCCRRAAARCPAPCSGTLLKIEPSITDAPRRRASRTANGEMSTPTASTPSRERDARGGPGPQPTSSTGPSRAPGQRAPRPPRAPGSASARAAAPRRARRRRAATRRRGAGRGAQQLRAVQVHRGRSSVAPRRSNRGARSRRPRVPRCVREARRRCLGRDEDRVLVAIDVAQRRRILVRRPSSRGARAAPHRSDAVLIGTPSNTRRSGRRRPIVQ